MRDRNFISEAKMRWNYLQANKPPGTQLAHYKLDIWTAAAWNKGFSSNVI